MSSNEKLIRDNYSKHCDEDQRAVSSRVNSIEFYYTKKFAGQYINLSTSVIEIGCGTGYYGMHFADKCKEYVGIDLSPENIAKFNGKIKSGKLNNVIAMVGDATKLDHIEDCRFDVVMALGPMYHLTANEKELAFSECKRICKFNGIIIFAYLNKAGAYVRACLDFPDKYPDKNVTNIVLKEGTDDIRSGMFFYTMPEEIEEQAKSHGLSKIKNIGVDFIFKEKLINGMNENQFEAWMELSDFLCESETCTGLSGHALIICRKESS